MDSALEIVSSSAVENDVHRMAVKAVAEEAGEVDLSAYLKRMSGRDTEMMARRRWIDDQLNGALVASILAARLLHVRSLRLKRFSLVKDAETVTLAQLAGLFRKHQGTFGHGFEVAVCDAINDGVPEVVDPIERAIARIGVHAPIVGAAHVALENLTEERRANVIEALRRGLPEDARFRNGLPGRPATPDTALRWLGQSTFRDSGERKLGKADLVLWTQKDIVAASCKVNPRALVDHTEAWRDVPLWITTARPVSLRRTVSQSPSPMEVAEIGGLWLSRLKRLSDLVDHVLYDVDLNKRSPTPVGFRELYTSLRKWRDESVATIISRLRERVTPKAVLAFPEPQLVIVETQVPTAISASRHLLTQPRRPAA